MLLTYHARLETYTGEGKLPLWTELVKRGRHPERQFHDHDFTELAIVFEGSGEHVAGAFRAPIGKGDAVLIQPGVAHAYDKLKGFELFNVIYDARKLAMPLLDARKLQLVQKLFPEGAGETGEDMASPVIRVAAPELSRIKALALELDAEARGALPGNSFRALALFMDLAASLARLGELAEPDRRARFLIGEAIGFLNANFNRKVSVDELAAKAKMSKRSFFRQFKQECGRTPGELLQELRLRKAAELLSMTDKGLDEIALNCGLYDGNYLCRQFKERFKRSPRKFRLESRGEA